MTNQRSDPYLASTFRVVSKALPALGFSEVRGLSVELADHGDAATNQPSRDASDQRETRSPLLELRRGITDEQALWTWLQQWIGGNITPQDVRICLLDEQGNPVRGWICVGATPVRWRGPTLVADQATVATETLELAHQGIEAVTDLEECCDPHSKESSNAV